MTVQVRLYQPTATTATTRQPPPNAVSLPNAVGCNSDHGACPDNQSQRAQWSTEIIVVPVRNRCTEPAGPDFECFGRQIEVVVLRPQRADEGVGVDPHGASAREVARAAAGLVLLGAQDYAGMSARCETQPRDRQHLRCLPLIALSASRRFEAQWQACARGRKARPWPAWPRIRRPANTATPRMSASTRASSGRSAVSGHVPRSSDARPPNLRFASPVQIEGRGSAAALPLRPHPAAAIAAGSEAWSLSSNGRPGTRLGVRTPHLRAAMPVDAYSLAVSCGGRGVSCDIWPASLSARAAPRAALSRARRGSPRPARCVAPRSIRRHAGFPAHCAFPRHAAFLAVGGAAPIRALPRIWRTVPCDASTAYAAAFAAWHWVVTVG